MQPDAFKSYLNAIGNYPLLTADQEIQLSRQIQQMLELKEADRELSPAEQRQVKIGERAKEKLIKCNLKLVVHIAKRYTRRLVSNNMETLDLVQEGNMGLDRAAEKFDGTRGYKFSTYAYWWIRQAITRAIDTHERVVRRYPTMAEMAEHVEMKEHDLRMLLERSTPHTSLDASAKDEGSRLLDLMADKSHVDDDFTPSEMRERHDQLHDALAALNEKQRVIIEMYYGLKDGREVSLKEIGETLGLSREVVRKHRDRGQR
ncbi:MAG: sigma-70 family RNA polymerase sigma factor, partial [Marivivens sp.]|nr:sigma-70 family RNA polymerase sigma factor [Marivivens sp.]